MNENIYDIRSYAQFIQCASDVFSKGNKVNNTNNDIAKIEEFVHRTANTNSAADNFRVNISKCLYHYNHKARARHMYA